MIVFVANCFVDLFADISNNVCMKFKKKNIVPSHAYQALKELHLGDYIPFLLSDNQNLSLKQILVREHSFLKGIDFNPGQDIDEEWYAKNGKVVIDQLLKRLNDMQNEKD